MVWRGSRAKYDHCCSAPVRTFTTLTLLQFFTSLCFVTMSHSPSHCILLRCYIHHLTVFCYDVTFTISLYFLLYRARSWQVGRLVPGRCVFRQVEVWCTVPSPAAVGSICRSGTLSGSPFCARASGICWPSLQDVYGKIVLSPIFFRTKPRKLLQDEYWIK